MTTPAFEVFLAKLYTDAEFRRRFLDDPQLIADRSCLSAQEVSHLLAIDRVGLELAAKTFAYKRARAGRNSSRRLTRLRAIFHNLTSRF
jgi:hypothetical protein